MHTHTKSLKAFIQVCVFDHLAFNYTCARRYMSTCILQKHDIATLHTCIPFAHMSMYIRRPWQYLWDINIWLFS